MYRARLNMVAIIFMKRTKYACNESDDWDLIYLQSWSKKGLNMLAILKIVLESRDYDFCTNLAKTNFR